MGSPISDFARLRTRLIHVSSDALRLYRTTEDGMDTDERYVALCYRWHKDHNFYTYGCNMSDLCEGMDIDKLPLTIQDAITATRELGIRFLWVDPI